MKAQAQVKTMKVFRAVIERGGKTAKRPGGVHTNILREEYFFAAETIQQVWEEIAWLRRGPVATVVEMLEEIPDIKILGAEQEVLEETRNHLNTALNMLAGWCVAIETYGANWDDFEEYYKDAMYRPGPLRVMLDAAIAKHRE